MSSELKRIESLFKRSLKYEAKNEWNIGANFEKDLEYELSLERKILENDARQFEEELIKNPIEEEVKRETNHNDALMKLFTSNADNIATITQVPKNQYYKNTYTLSRKSDIIDKIYITVKSSTNIQDILNSSFTIESNGNDIFPKTKIFTLLLTQMFYEQNIVYDEEKEEYQIPLLDFTIMANNKNLINGFPICNLLYSNNTIIIEPEGDINLDINVYQESKLLSIEGRNEILKHTFYSLFPRSNLMYSYRCCYSQDCVTININKTCLSKFLMISFKNVDITPSITNAFIEGGDYVEWEEDEILTVNMLDQKFFILPLTKEFSTWENILQSFKDVDEKILKTPFYSCNNTKLTIYTDMELKNSLIELYSYNFRLLSVAGGTCAFQYC